MTRTHTQFHVDGKLFEHDGIYVYAATAINRFNGAVMEWTGIGHGVTRAECEAVARVWISIRERQAKMQDEIRAAIRKAIA